MKTTTILLSILCLGLGQGLYSQGKLTGEPKSGIDQQKGLNQKAEPFSLNNGKALDELKANQSEQVQEMFKVSAEQLFSSLDSGKTNVKVIPVSPYKLSIRIEE